MKRNRHSFFCRVRSEATEGGVGGSREKESWEICLVQNASPDGPLNGPFTVIPTRRKQSGGHPATRLLCSQESPPHLTRHGGYGQPFSGLRARARKMPAVASASILRGLDVSPTQDLNECMPPRFIRACDDNAVRTMPERGSLFEPANFCLGKNALNCPAEAPTTTPQGQKRAKLPRSGAKDCPPGAKAP